MLTWPHDDSAWAPWLPRVEPVFDQLALVLAARAGALVTARDDLHARYLRRRLAAAGVATRRVRIGIAPSDDVWVRDHGPVTVLRDGRPVLLDFRFNAWGGKYCFQRDDRLPRTLWDAGCFGDVSMETVPLVVEGGALETDGAGTLLARESSVISAARNPGLDRVEMGERLRALLGTDRILWLRHGHLEGDDTDGHIDTLARFAGVGTIVYQAGIASRCHEFRALQAMATELAALRQRDGRPYRLIPLPRAAPIEAPDGRPLPASYANFLVCNGAVLVPVYGDPADHLALERLGEAFPGYELMPVDCRGLILELGSLHCATMQLPWALCWPETRAGRRCRTPDAGTPPQRRRNS